ncbi:uncharacterized protein LOC117341169 [Pecten maximus]|uniref:uncharacterized protein LOC117341169 n=1 Tax=Pecten maximus TaxID=6579 RepID=UPI001458903A|nr:uncharacterized protein LOC117341169 [Pecten maximus]
MICIDLRDVQFLFSMMQVSSVTLKLFWRQSLKSAKAVLQKKTTFQNNYGKNKKKSNTRSTKKTPAAVVPPETLVTIVPQETPAIGVLQETSTTVVPQETLVTVGPPETPATVANQEAPIPDDILTDVILDKVDQTLVLDIADDEVLKALIQGNIFSTPEENSQITNDVNQKAISRFPFQNTSSPFDKDADVLPYPTSTTSVKNKKKVQERYFVLTSEEVISHKTKQLEAKQDKENKKETAKLQRTLKREAAKCTPKSKKVKKTSSKN